MLIVDTSCVSFYQVIMPDHLRGRLSHTTTIVHCDSTRRQLVSYGGIYEIPEDGKSASFIPVADTTIMELGEWDLYLISSSSSLVLEVDLESHCTVRNGKV